MGCLCGLLLLPEEYKLDPITCILHLPPRNRQFCESSLFIWHGLLFGPIHIRMAGGPIWFTIYIALGRITFGLEHCVYLSQPIPTFDNCASSYKWVWTGIWLACNQQTVQHLVCAPGTWDHHGVVEYLIRIGRIPGYRSCLCFIHNKLSPYYNRITSRPHCSIVCLASHDDVLLLAGKRNP